VVKQPLSRSERTRTLFAGGPETAACHQFDGNKSACLSSYHADQCGNAASCYYDDADALCNGCGPNNEQNGDCINSCRTGPLSCALALSAELAAMSAPTPRDAGALGVRGSVSDHKPPRTARTLKLSPLLT
jgi:hypothetical protein